jgi:biotin transporter BioY
LGSLAGLVPGILITNFFAHQLNSAIREPGLGTFLILAALIVITIVGTVWLKRRLEP